LVDLFDKKSSPNKFKRSRKLRERHTYIENVDTVPCFQTLLLF